MKDCLLFLFVPNVLPTHGVLQGLLLVAFSLLGHSGLIYWRMVSLFPMRYLCAKWNSALCVY